MIDDGRASRTKSKYCAAIVDLKDHPTSSDKKRKKTHAKSTWKKAFEVYLEKLDNKREDAFKNDESLDDYVEKLQEVVDLTIDDDKKPAAKITKRKAAVLPLHPDSPTKKKKAPRQDSVASFFTKLEDTSKKKKSASIQHRGSFLKKWDILKNKPLTQEDVHLAVVARRKVQREKTDARLLKVQAEKEAREPADVGD